MTYSLKAIKRSEAQGGDGIYREDADHSPDPADAAYPLKRRFTFDPGEGSDGLDAARGLRSAVIIEALALGLVWLGWYCAGLLAAWWRAWQ